MKSYISISEAGNSQYVGGLRLLRHALKRFLGAVAVVVTLAYGPVSAGATTVVTDIRVGTAAGTTRIVFEFTERLSFRVFTLANPYRIVIDMPEVGWRLPPRPLPAASGVYDKLRYGLYKPGNSRVVLDLRQASRIKQASLVAPNGAYAYRLVLELGKTTHANFLAAVKAGAIAVNGGAITSPPARAVVVSRSPAAALQAKGIVRSRVPDVASVRTAPKRASKPTVTAARKPRVSTVPRAKVKPRKFELAPRKPGLRPAAVRYAIALDPGHGGVDPGTVGHSGTHEKHITLSMARSIRAALERTGRYRVIMTRDRDIFLQLRDRIKVAREAGANLFVSIHADSIKNQKIHGPSVYTLSERASDKEAAQLAEKENKADLIAGIDLTHSSKDVTNILIDLAQRDAMNQSARFASLLVGELKKRTQVLRNTHRFAGFAVLKAPDVPSVLLELGFLSNPRDERQLRSRDYRGRLAAGVAKAIDGYFARVEQAARN